MKERSSILAKHMYTIDDGDDAAKYETSISLAKPMRGSAAAQVCNMLDWFKDENRLI